MLNILTHLSGPAFVFQALVHHGQSISFEYFLNDFYETVISIKENGALIHTANVDIKAHDIVSSPVNASAFDITWSVDIQYKVHRGGQYNWAQAPITITANDSNGNIQFVSNNPGNQYIPSMQLALVNISIR